MRGLLAPCARPILLTGGGKFVPVTSGKPIVAGTGQGCVRASGTYELSR